MYLSRVILNPEHPEALRAVGNPYRLHQLLWQAFPDREDGGAGRVLFRLETQQSIPAPVALVQSEHEPDWRALHPVVARAESRPYTPAVSAGQILRFRLRANPTKRLPAPSHDKDGQRVQLFKEEEQLAWLKRKAAEAGFRVLECRVSGVERQVSRKGDGPRVIHQAVTFDGLLQVTGPDTFTEAVASGIGPAKGFGFGLLSLARSG